MPEWIATKDKLPNYLGQAVIIFINGVAGRQTQQRMQSRSATYHHGRA